MVDFECNLLREKFVITNVAPSDGESSEGLIAHSNRLVLSQSTSKDNEPEVLVIRAQNMHICTRYASVLAREFKQRGPLVARQMTYNWDAEFKDIITGYEKNWNDDLWLVVYHKGEPVYEYRKNKRHALLDLIELCDVKNNDSYEQSLQIARDSFTKEGSAVEIDYTGNLGMVMTIDGDKARCGLIIRNANRTTTFTIGMKTTERYPEITPQQCLVIASTFLECVQLAHFIGTTHHMKTKGKISDSDNRKSIEASNRLATLSQYIEQFESQAGVMYRPEKPDFSIMIASAETTADRF